METEFIQKVRFYLTQKEWKEMIKIAETIGATSTLSRLKMADVVIHKNQYYHVVIVEVKDERQAQVLKGFNLPIADMMVDWIMNPTAARDHQMTIEADRMGQIAMTVADARSAIADELQEWE